MEHLQWRFPHFSYVPLDEKPYDTPSTGLGKSDILGGNYLNLYLFVSLTDSVGNDFFIVFSKICCNSRVVLYFSRFKSYITYWITSQEEKTRGTRFVSLQKKLSG